jgi:hypothetical protein
MKKRRKSQKSTKKVRIAVDECSYSILDQNKICKVANVKSIDNLIGRKGASDSSVYFESNIKGRHIITENTKDFKGFIKSKNDVGIIAHTAFNEKVFNNIHQLIKENDHDHFHGKFYSVSQNKILLKKDFGQ